MTKFKNISVVLLILILTSCTKNPIIGLWRQVGVRIDGMPEWEFRQSYFCFRDDDTLVSRHWIDSENIFISYSFDLENKVLSFQEKDGPVSDYTIKTFNDSLMILVQNSYQLTFKKIQNCSCE